MSNYISQIFMQWNVTRQLMYVCDALIAYILFFNAQSLIVCEMQCHFTNCISSKHNAMSLGIVLVQVHSLYIILQCTTLDRVCNAMQQLICYLFNEHGKQLVLVQVPICYSSMHNVRSFVQCKCTYACCKHMLSL